MASKESILATFVESPLDAEELLEYLKTDEYQDEFTRKLSIWIKDQIHSIFKDGNLKGVRLLDIGTGAVAYPVVTASNWFDEIYLSDMSKSCLDILEKWRRGESDHMVPSMKLFSEKEGGRVTWETLNRQVVKKIKGIFEFDVHRPNLYAGTVLKNAPYDAVTLSLVLSGIDFTMDEFCTSLRNIRNLLQPGGHLIACDVVDQKMWKCRKIRYRKFSSSVNDLIHAYIESGFIIQQWNSYLIDVGQSFDQGTMLYSVVATKPESQA